MCLLKEQEIKDIMTPPIEENHTYGLIEDDDNYAATEPEEEVIEVEQMEAAERAERITELEAAEVVTRNRRRNKMAYYRTTPAYEKRMELRLKKALKRFKKMKKILIPHTMYDPMEDVFELVDRRQFIDTHIRKFQRANNTKMPLDLADAFEKVKDPAGITMWTSPHVEHDITSIDPKIVFDYKLNELQEIIKPFGLTQTSRLYLLLKKAKLRDIVSVKKGKVSRRN